MCLSAHSQGVNKYMLLFFFFFYKLKNPESRRGREKKKREHDMECFFAALFCSSSLVMGNSSLWVTATDTVSCVLTGPSARAVIERSRRKLRRRIIYSRTRLPDRRQFLIWPSEVRVKSFPRRAARRSSSPLKLSSSEALLQIQMRDDVSFCRATYHTCTDRVVPRLWSEQAIFTSKADDTSYLLIHVCSLL